MVWQLVAILKLLAKIKTETFCNAALLFFDPLNNCQLVKQARVLKL